MAVTPVPSTPTIPDDHSGMWNTGAPPEVMAGFLAWFLRAHFSEPANIVDPSIKDRTWTPGVDVPGQSAPDSAIAIDTVDAFDPRLVELRPALIVADHEWQPQPVGIANNMMQMTYEKDGFDRYSSVYHSSATVFAIAKAPKEAKRLATEACRQLVQYSAQIRKELGLLRFVVVKKGGVVKIEESTDHYAVPVDVAWIAEETFKVQLQTQRIKRIILNVTTTFG